MPGHIGVYVRQIILELAAKDPTLKVPEPFKPPQKPDAYQGMVRQLSMEEMLFPTKTPDYLRKC